MSSESNPYIELVHVNHDEIDKYLTYSPDSHEYQWARNIDRLRQQGRKLHFFNGSTFAGIVDEKVEKIELPLIDYGQEWIVGGKEYRFCPPARVIQARMYGFTNVRVDNRLVLGITYSNPWLENPLPKDFPDPMHIAIDFTEEEIERLGKFLY